jgi:isopenicillin N synthase-like dioxygenase
MSAALKTNTSVPLIDVSALQYGGEEAINSTAGAISSACRSIGFFYIIGHGISPVICNEVIGQARDIFDLPLTSKLDIDIQRSKYMRDYFGHGADKSDGINDDIKEGYDMALDLSSDDPYVKAGLPFYGPNAWPDDLPDFKPVMNGYYDSMVILGRRLLRAFAIGLNIQENYFDSHFQKPIAQIRLLRYPPALANQAPPNGAGEHTDFGWLTMILQDEVGGLEVKNKEGVWMDVPPMPGAFVVNVGDLMQRWTNDRYPATLHRVINRAGRERYSVAFFMDPDYHAEVACLSTCVSKATPAKYEPIIVGDYMDHRFLETTTFRAK